MTTIQAQNLSGHLGFLTPNQQAKFQQFKDNLDKANLYKPAVDGMPASHDEPTLLCVLDLGTLSAPFCNTRMFHQGVFYERVDSIWWELNNSFQTVRNGVLVRFCAIRIVNDTIQGGRNMM